MTATRFIIDLLLNSYGRYAAQLRHPLLQELEKLKIETSLKYVSFKFVSYYIICTKSLDKSDVPSE